MISGNMKIGEVIYKERTKQAKKGKDKTFRYLHLQRGKWSRRYSEGETQPREKNYRSQERRALKRGRKSTITNSEES